MVEDRCEMSENNSGGGQGGGQGGGGGEGRRPRRRSGRPRRRRGKGKGDPAKNAQGQQASGTSGSGRQEKSREGQPRDKGARQGGKDDRARGGGLSTGGRSKRSRRGGGDSKSGQDRDRKRDGRGSRKGRDRRGGDEGSRRARPQEKTGRFTPPSSEGRKGKDDLAVEVEKMFEGSSEDYESMAEGQVSFLKPHEVDEDLLYEDMPVRDFREAGRLMDVTGVKLHDSGAIIDYDCQDMILLSGDEVIVETGRGLALGRVLVPSTRRMIRKEKVHRIIRKATHNDMRQRERNVSKEKQAREICKQAIERFGLDMKLIRVDYLHGGNKAVFYFSAEGRVDFRELVRELARKLHIRVEMRQIGVRDASRMVGGIGSCGLRLCCNSYIREFAPVSIRMAKDQDLVLNPEKVSGVCGRLMCCLSYEDSVYKEAAKSMPKVGRRVITPAGEGRIRDRDVLKRVVRVQIPDQPGLQEFPAEDVKPLHPSQQEQKRGGKDRGGQPRPDGEAS